MSMMDLGGALKDGHQGVYHLLPVLDKLPVALGLLGIELGDVGAGLLHRAIAQKEFAVGVGAKDNGVAVEIVEAELL